MCVSEHAVFHARYSRFSLNCPKERGLLTHYARVRLTRRVRMGALAMSIETVNPQETQARRASIPNSISGA
jgi:hypothetical protein